ncbi:MAG: hypothetical protein NTX50_01620 [Candidatus Sumerlaeota bacterium]|nr:hypothetical protein [Candidatus Sumerlaeota bacterium]
MNSEKKIFGLSQPARRRDTRLWVFLPGIVLTALTLGCLFACQMCSRVPPQKPAPKQPVDNGPEMLRLAGECATPGRPRDILLFDSLALVALNREGLCWVDMSNISAPRLLAHAASPRPLQMRRAGKSVFMAELDAGVSAWNFSDPRKPVALSRLETPSGAIGIELAPPRIYVACGPAGLLVGQYDEAASITVSHHYRLSIQYARNAVAMGKDTLLFSDTLAGAVHTLRIPGSGPLELLSGVKSPLYHIDSVALRDRIGYVNYRVAVGVVDYSNIGDPKFLAPIFRDQEGKVTGLSLRGDCLFVIRDTAGMDMYDVSKPAQPRFAGHSALAHDITELAFKDDYIIALCWDERMRVYKAAPSIAKLMKGK